MTPTDGSLPKFWGRSRPGKLKADFPIDFGKSQRIEPLLMSVRICTSRELKSEVRGRNWTQVSQCAGTHCNSYAKHLILN